MRRTASRSRAGKVNWRTGALALGILTVIAGCHGGEPPEPGVGVARPALLNAAGAYVATAETTTDGAKLNGTTYAQTQLDDGVDEQLVEAGSAGAKKVTHTWTLGSVSGTAFTLTVKAKKLEGTGDSFSFGWGTAAAGPFTVFCTVGTADTSYKTCAQAVTVAAGTTALYVQVTDSVRTGDPTVNTLNVDYVAAAPSGGGVCGNGTVETGEACDLGTSNGQPGSCCTAACAFVAAGTVCRAAAGTCDVAETCDGTSAACPTDTFVAVGTVCRAAAGQCDVAEACTGANATCPVDAPAPAGTACDDGQACTGPDACDGAGACVGPAVTACAGGDGCCPAGCNSVTDGDCVAAPPVYVATAETTASGSKLNGTTFVQTQADDGTAEQLAESGGGSGKKLTHTWTIGDVSGTELTLTVKAKKLEGTGDSFSFGWATVAAGPFTAFCTVGTADTGYKSCTQAVTVAAGTAALYVRVTDSAPTGDTTVNTLHVDYLAAAASGGGVCGNGAVETGEACDLGTSNGLPGSCCTSACAFVAAGTVCRAGAGTCDVAETCTGASATCPADAKAAAGTECRAAAGSCDVAEVCDGTGVACPSDGYAVAGSAGSPPCSPYVCSGTAPSCPTSCTLSTQCASGYECAGSACVSVTACGDGVVQAPEVCDQGSANGTSGSCCTTSCTLKAAGTVCRPDNGGGCDLPEACDGVNGWCPVDAGRPNGTVCRVALSPTCDAPEVCDGTSAPCPAEGGHADLGLPCADASPNDCSAAQCNGNGYCDQTQGVEPAIYVCRADNGGGCDLAELCDGVHGGACPADLGTPAGTVCRAALDAACDTAETCNGTSAACPIEGGHAPAGGACDDGAYCTVSDQCDGVGHCVGTPRDCSSYGDGKCLVGSCEEFLDTCVAINDPVGDGNACTTDDVCLPSTGSWYAVVNECDGVSGLSAMVTADGIRLTWTLPQTQGLTAVEVYRTTGSPAISKPGVHLDARVYADTGSSFVDRTAVAGQRLTYVAFAVYAAGWSRPATVSAQLDDADHDGMTDGWELEHGLNPSNAGDALLDGDGDGLSNLVEFVLGTDPGVADSDGDGLKDGAEVVRGTDPNRQDTDGDGMTDLFEISQGLDPLNGHDFAIGDYAVNGSYVLGAYMFDSGKYAFDPATGLPTIASATKQLALASQQQASPIGVLGSAGRYGHAGYLYTTEEFIAPNYPPICDAGLDQGVTLPTTVQLSGAASDPNGDPVLFQWGFVQVPAQSGVTDASLANAASATPSFVPDRAGYYMLQLAVRDATGLYGAPCFVVVTALDGQVFYKTGPFTAISSHFKMVAHATSLAGGFPQPLLSATRRVGLVVGDRGVPGNAESAVTVLDAGFMATAYAPYDPTLDPNVINVAPVAVAGSDQTVPAGSTVTLDGSLSHDPDAYPAALTHSWFVWQRPYGSTATLGAPTAAVTTFTPDRAGSYVFTLTVDDGDLHSVPAAVVVTVANTAPVAQAGPDQYVELTSPAPVVTLDGSASYDPEGKPLSYHWRLWRAPDGSLAALANATTATPSFTPDRVGFYRLELVVKDGSLVSVPDYVTIGVSQIGGNLPPVAAVGPGQQLMGVNSTGLDGSGSYDPDWDQVTWPDPDAQGVFRKGLGYDWVILQRPTGSTAYVRCTTIQSPVSDCPNPVLYFNGYNGTYLVGLRVIDASLATSDQVTVAVTVADIPNEPPIAVATPAFKKINFKDALARTVTLDGAASRDPINASETLTYTWTLVEKPAGSTAALTSAATSATGLTLDRIGRYRAHLKVCDSTGQCSCGPTEVRAGDANCNARSFAVISTSDDFVRVGMPTDWPVAGLRGGSGGRLTLLKSPDGIYDKPVVFTVGFNGFFAAAGGAAGQNELGPFAAIIETLRSRGYDVWWLNYDPICSDGAIPNLDANWAWGGQEFCQSQTCACPFPQQPVDNRMSLNAVVLAQAVAQAKAYETCGGKSADDPTDPCFVRVFGPSMGGLVSRYALAWAEDAAQVTVPYAANESAPYALNGLRAKPAGVTSWDLGARVFVAGDAPMQGANVPVSLQALVKGFEANTPDAGASGGAFAGIGFQTSGVANLIAWSFLNHQGLRNWALDHKAQLEQTQSALSLWGFGGERAQGLAGLVSGLLTLAQLGENATVSGFVGLGVVTGFLEGLVAGWGTAIVGAVINGAWAYLEAQLLTYLSSLGPWGVFAAVVYVILDFFFDFGSFLFSVKTRFDLDVVEERSQVLLTPFSMTKILEAPAAREMLYETVTSFARCPDMPMLAQGLSVPNRWPAGFGKEQHGRICRGTPNITATTAYHDQFYTHLQSLNGGRGYPLRTRNVGMAFGSGEPALPDGAPILELYMPYVLANQEYPASARDREPGSIYGTELVGHLVPFQLWARGALEIKTRTLFFTDTSYKLIFDDRAYFPTQPLLTGATWSFVPTQSALDLTRPPSCSSQLPCCQVLPKGTAPHPQDDGARNCCQCTTSFDAVLRPDISLLHSAPLFVNPCLRGQNPESPLIETLRNGCVSPFQGEQPGNVQMCTGDATWYVKESPQGFACSPVHDDLSTRAALDLMHGAIAQLDTRPTCAATSASFVCLDGATTCAAAAGRWLWLGGHDRDGDGCPGPVLANGTVCPTSCETDAQDGDPTVVGNVPQGNSPPSIVALSPAQLFALPGCTADVATRRYRCSVGQAAAGGDLSVAVTASDPDGDPLTYQWEFLPDPAQGQTGTDLTLSSAAGSAPKVSVMTTNRPPQGSYRLRVTVFDNKGGSASAETSVAVPCDAPPAVAVLAPATVNELCDYGYDPDTDDNWRCYADLELTATVTDPDGVDTQAILMYYWEDVTDREESGYRGVTVVDDPTLLNAGLMVHASEDHVSTPVGYPLRFRLTAVDRRGQRTSAEAAVQVCLTAGCQ